MTPRKPIPANPSPTPAELEILNVLWNTGSATVREVYESLQGERGVGYTTVLKLMQIMADKGLVLRDTTQRSHVYRPAFSRSRLQSGLLDDLIQRAFSGSLQQLLVRALDSRKTSPEELRAIRKLLDENESK